MSFKKLQVMPTPEEIISEFPLDDRLKDIKAKRDKEIKSVFDGTSSKMVLIIGPCSADSEEPVVEYCNRLAEIQKKVEDKLVLIPRIYTNKPRTTGIGYKGMMHQPNPSEEPNMAAGVRSIRKLHMRVLKETGMSSADEMLYPDNYDYLADLLGYVAVGARSVENQQHRLTCSGVEVPVGMKNPTSGDFSVMLNSILASQSPHDFCYRNHEVLTKGNPYTHAILRGAVDNTGRNIPNYHYEDIISLEKKYRSLELENPGLIIDCNHANSMKKFEEQPRIVKETLANMKNSAIIRGIVKGFMVESYLEEGRQEIGENVYGKSITDACIGWDDTEDLIYYIASHI
jgi:3-deoxy-7-phosphoheptulonate synthase